MPDQKLIDTIKHKISLGVSQEDILETLVSLGWKEDEAKNTLIDLNYQASDKIKYQNKLLKEKPQNQPPVSNIQPQVQIEPSAPQIVFTGETEVVHKEKGGNKGQLILTAIIILFTVIGAACFIFFEEIKNIDPSKGLEGIVKIFTGGKKPETNETSSGEPAPVVLPPIKDNETLYGPYDTVGELMMSSDNFTFFYEKGGSQFVNINGSSYGPSQIYSSEGVSRPIVPSIYNQNFGFSYYDKDKDSWYVNINGRVSGPYIEVSNVYYSSKGYVFAGKKKDSIYYYINLNGNEEVKNPYVSVDNNIYLSDDGTYSFSYTSNSKKNININGKVFGPYNETGKGIMYKDNDFYFLYSENGKEFVNISGKAYESNGSIVYDYLKNQFEFHYTKDGKRYVNINGKEVLGDEKTVLATNYFYKNSTSEYFVNVGEKKEGPYKKTTLISKANTNYIFGYQLNDGQWFVNINGQGNGTAYQDVSSAVFINQNNKYSYAFQYGGKWYVIVK
jgi:hypothetical protein